MPAAGRYYKMANRDYLEWAKLGFVGSTAPITIQFYAETLQRFRLAAQGHGAAQPPERDRARVERFFDPLPFWYASLATKTPIISTQRHHAASDVHVPRLGLAEPLAAPDRYAQRALHPSRYRARRAIADGDWIWISSPRGRIRVQARTHAATAPGTVWTWNAIGKRRGAWKLAATRPSSTTDFCSII